MPDATMTRRDITTRGAWQLAGFQATDPQKPSSGVTLLQRFTLISLLTTIVVGTIFGALAARVAEGYALRSRARAAAVYVSEFVAPRLLPGDFSQLSPAGRVQFEFTLRSLIGRAGIVRVTVWHRNGQVLYSDDAALVGRRYPLSPAVQEALRGQLEWQLVSARQATSSRVPQVMVFVPVVVSGDPQPVAVYEVLSELIDLPPALARLRRSMWATVVLAIIILYAGLFTIVGKASLDLHRQQSALHRAFVGFIQSLARAIDARDVGTAQHSSRVAEYAVATARELALSETAIGEVQVAAFLHDVGKIGIRDDLLAKRGKLTKEEWEAMRHHAVFGHGILDPVPIAQEIKLAVRNSHERWDGTGYPDRLAGEQIPIAARVIAVSDAYEALTNDRPYRPARSHEEALAEMRRNAGTQFDPRVVDAFIRALQRQASPEQAKDQHAPGTPSQNRA